MPQKGGGVGKNKALGKNILVSKPSKSILAFEYMLLQLFTHLQVV